MPAPAVIPALIAYVKVVAVKTLVVGARSSESCVGNRSVALVKGTPATDNGGRRSKAPVAALFGDRRVGGLRSLGPAWVPFTMTKPG